MNKNKRIILIILGIGMFFAMPVFANGLEVNFEYDSEPLFDKANFLPGETVTRWIDVTNNSGETKNIGLEIIDDSSCSGTCLSDVLDLVISENGSPLYSGSLTTFYKAGEKILSDLGIRLTTKYYFSMTFNPDAENIYQNSTTNFDIKIGFFGEESIGKEITSGGGGGGGGRGIIVAGLEISDEQFSKISANSVTIIWDTNFGSTSRVIYSPEGFPHLLQLNNPPNYGYVFSTDEDPNKVINHSITITGLIPETTYYYRSVSHGSFALSTEYSFTTLAEGEDPVFIDYSENDEEKRIVQGEVKGAIDIISDDKESVEKEEKEEKEDEKEDEKDKEEIAEESFSLLFTGGFLASIFDLFKSITPYLLLFIFIIILIILFLLFRKKRTKSSDLGRQD